VFAQKRHLLAPDVVSRFFEILDVAKLRLQFQKRSSLVRNQNLPLLSEHSFFAYGIFWPGRRFYFFAILSVEKLHLRLQKRSSLACRRSRFFVSGNQNLPFLSEHEFFQKRHLYPGTACFGI